jgi:hypothetical protein
MYENLNDEASLTEDKISNNIKFEVCCRIQEKANNMGRDSSNDFMNCISNNYTEKINVKVILINSMSKF